MRKPILVLLLLVALALAACGQLTPPEITRAPALAQPTEAIEQLALPTTAPVQEQTTAAPTTAPTPANPECRVDTGSQADPALANRFPKVGEKEWAKGPEGAYVNIEEYSDFQ